MPEASFQKSVARGVAWVAVASAMVAAFDLIALALILQEKWATKEDYGTVSIAVTLFGAIQLIGEAGLTSSLVQAEEADDDRRSTIYWTTVGLGLALFGIVWVVSPWIASAYELPILVPLFRIAGLVLVIRPLYATHQALQRKELRFSEISIVRIIANVLELATKLGIAIWVGGPWPWVMGPAVRELTYAIGTPLYYGWRPKLVCRFSLIREDFRFGVRSTGGELLYQIYSNLDYQVVGYAFGPGALGVYRAAYELVLEPVRFVSGVITVVAFPTFARLRGDGAACIAQFIAFTRQNLAIVGLMVGVIVVAAADLLDLTYGADYTVASHAARVLAIVGSFRALSHLGPPLLDGLGKPGLSLRYQVVASVVLTVLFVAASWVGDTFFSVAVAWAIGYPIAFAVLWWMVLFQLQLPLATYVKKIGTLVVWIVLATVVGLGAHTLAEDLGAFARLVVAAVTVIGVGMVLLGRFEGLSVREVVRSLR